MAAALLMAAGIAYAATRISRDVGGALVVGSVQTEEETLLLYGQIEPSPAGLEELNFGTVDVDAFGFFAQAPRVMLWARNGGGVPFTLTVRATDVMVTRGGGSPTPLREGGLALLMGPRGGELRPAPEHGVVFEPNDEPVAQDVGLRFSMTPAELELGPGDALTFTALFEAEAVGGPVAPPGATLYQDTDFQGISEAFTLDQSNECLIGSVVGDNTASSIRVAPDTKAILYTHCGFSGRFEEFTTDDPDLSDNLIGSNTVSSIRVMEAEPPGTVPTGKFVSIQDSNPDHFSDQAMILITRVPPHTPDEAYEGWFVNDDGTRKESTGILVVRGDGVIEQGFQLMQNGVPTGENFVAGFDKFVVTVEPVPDPGPSAEVKYIGQRPAGAMVHIRHLLFSWEGNPPYTGGFHQGVPKGIVVGLREQTDVALTHAKLSHDSANLAGVHLHACHVVNVIEGAGGPNFDPSCGNPGDDFGVLGYAEDAEVHAGLARAGAPEDGRLGDGAAAVAASAGAVGVAAAQARDGALNALASRDPTAAKLFMGNVQALLDRSLNGWDANQNGELEPGLGEGGAVHVYDAAQHMGGYVLTAPAP